MENYIFFLINGQPLFSDGGGEVCIQNIDDGSIQFATITDELQHILNEQFPNIKKSSCQIKDTPCGNDSIAAASTSNGSSTTEKHWSRSATLHLIATWKEFEGQFKSTTIKNDQVWQMVAQKLRLQGFCYTHVQCKDRWQYLKKRYMKKRDNGGPRGTGEERINFEFYDELHQLLGNKHNVTPPAIASSLAGLSSNTSDDTDDKSNSNILEESEDDERPLKKKKKHSMKKKDAVLQFMEDVRESNARKEANRERRHQELVNCRNKTTEIFAEKMDQLIGALKK